MKSIYFFIKSLQFQCWNYYYFFNFQIFYFNKLISSRFAKHQTHSAEAITSPLTFIKYRLTDSSSSSCRPGWQANSLLDCWAIWLYTLWYTVFGSKDIRVFTLAQFLNKASRISTGKKSFANLNVQILSGPYGSNPTSNNYREIHCENQIKRLIECFWI